MAINKMRLALDLQVEQTESWREHRESVVPTEPKAQEQFRDINKAYGDPDSLGYGEQDETYYLRSTPMERDIMLQAAEITYRSIIEGYMPPASVDQEVQAWEEEHLGAEWSEQNELQRQELLRQVRISGEKTPAWMECVAHMGDIAWEMLEGGDKGERFRKHENIDRNELVEQFRALNFKVSVSYYGRCGAGDRVYGFRACIGIYHIFIRDPDVLKIMTSTLSYTITAHDYNRNSLTSITVPPLPLERLKGHKDIGWSFLRNALNAFVVQSGGVGYGEQGDEEHSPNCTNPEVALEIAKLLVLTSKAPAVLVQLVIVHDEVPEDAWMERAELKAIIPLALKQCDVMDEVMPKEQMVWMQLKFMLSKGPYEHMSGAPRTT